MHPDIEACRIPRTSFPIMTSVSQSIEQSLRLFGRWLKSRVVLPPDYPPSKPRASSTSNPRTSRRYWILIQHSSSAMHVPNAGEGGSVLSLVRKLLLDSFEILLTLLPCSLSLLRDHRFDANLERPRHRSVVRNP